MKTIHIRYTLATTLIAELPSIFPEWDGVSRDITGPDNRHGYYKTETISILGVPTTVHDVYLLVPDDYVLPLLITGTVMTDGHTHYFMGHEPKEQ